MWNDQEKINLASVLVRFQAPGARGSVLTLGLAQMHLNRWDS